MQQDQIFLSGEGDRWLQRNKAKLGKAADWPLQLIERHGLTTGHVLEVGCANGWRLAHLAYRFGCKVTGVDPSLAAVADGRACWGLDLRLGTLAAIPRHAGEQWDVVITAFVWHWCDRSTLLASVAEVDAVLAPGGHLVLADFLPEQPCRVAYHHLDGLWTYKQDYAAMFTTSAGYREIERVVYDHDTGITGPASEQRQAVCALLRKEEDYCESRL